MTRLRPTRAMVLVALGLLLLAGCGTLPRHPVPEALKAEAEIPGYGAIRYWGDDARSISPDMLDLVDRQSRAAGRTGPRNFLAISGGGSDGAFGAGLLFGWSSKGTRPQFDIVTGISTGSLTAPFAFLGKPYDQELRDSYTKIDTADIYTQRAIFDIFQSASAADNTPLRHLVANYVTDQMVADITREYARGRRLLIGTTDLDAGRPVVWDIGAIAASGQPGRRKLIEDILVASASIPGVFPPVRIHVVADGVAYDELHVDGGTSNQAFMLPSNLSLREIDRRYGISRQRTLYVIRNGKVTPDYRAVPARLAPVIGRAVDSLIMTQGIGDLYRMYANAARDGVAFKAVWVPSSFAQQEKEPFDPAYMQALFDLGYAMGDAGVPWVTEPPQ